MQRLATSFVITTGLIVFLIIILYASPKYEYLWIMPYSYIILSILFNRNYALFGKSTVAAILLSMAYLKNVITPFCIALGKGDYFVVADTTDYLLDAYCLCIYELIVIFLVVYKMSSIFENRQTMDIQMEMSQKSVSIIYITTLLLLLMFIIIVAMYPQLLLSYDIEFASTEEESITQIQLANSVKESTPTLIYYSYLFLFNWLRWLIPLSFIFKLFHSRLIRGKVALCLSILIILFSAFLGTDYRAASIFLMVSLFLIMNKLYPSYRKTIVAMCVGGLMVIGVVGLIFKSFGADNTSEVDFQGLADILQAYFSGPDNVAVGLMIDGYPSIKMMIGDVFCFIPYIMYFFQGYDTSMIQFNYTFFEESDVTTQILPMISQGERYFSFIGAPFFTLLVSKLAIKMNLKSLSSKSILDYSIYMMMCVFLSFSISMYCFSQLFTIFFTVFFPTILLLKFSEWIIVKKQATGDNYQILNNDEDYLFGQSK